jgi:superfamily II DNA or RNA helicase
VARRVRAIAPGTERARASALPPFTLRPYQAEAAARAVTHLLDHERGQIVACCSSGKTPITLEIAVQLEAARVGILVPNLLLISQWARMVRRQRGDAPTILAVCSDPGGELQHSPYDIRVTNDPDEVRLALLLAAQPNAAPLVVLGTYHSSSVLAAATKGHREAVLDLLIADEAHRTAGAGADRCFRIPVLPSTDPAGIHAKRRLFITATPRDCPTPESVQHRPATVRLSDADAAVIGVEEFRFIPVLAERETPHAFREGPLRDGVYLPDGSLLAVRALVPAPYVDPEPEHPHELVRFLPEPGTGSIHPTRPRIDSRVVVPAAADVSATRAVVEYALTHGLLAPGVGIAAAATYFETKTNAPIYMDSRVHYGEIVADIPDAIVEAAGFTAPYRLVLMGVRASEIDAVLRTMPSPPAVASDVLEQMIASHIAIRRSAGAYAIHKGMVFNPGILEANAFASLSHWVARALDDATSPAITVDALHTDVPVRVRTATLARFADITRSDAPSDRSAVSLLSAVRMGQEGQDVPEMETVIFGSPKESDIDVVQAKGRAVRLDPARPEKVANVMIPLIVDDRTPVHQQSAVQRIAPYGRAIAASVLRGLLSTDERAVTRLVADGTTSTRDLPVAVSTRRDRAPLLAQEEIVRAVEHTMHALREEFAGLSPRRYTGVVYDPSVSAFRGHLAVRFPGADPTRRVHPLVDQVHPTARHAAQAVDRTIDEFGLDASVPRNFGRGFTVRRRDVAADAQTHYHGVVPAGRDAADGFVAVYRLARTGSLTMRYAATADEAALVRDALVARYGGTGRRNFPEQAPRHDLAVRAPRGEGVEFDSAVQRWWAAAAVPHLHDADGAPRSTGLGFFDTERDARRAVQLVQPAIAQLGATASAKDIELVARQALQTARLLPIALETLVERHHERPYAPRVVPLADNASLRSAATSVAPAAVTSVMMP